VEVTINDPNCPPGIACYQCKRPLIPKGAKLVQVKCMAEHIDTGEAITTAGSTYATALKYGAFPIYIGGLRNVEKPTLFCSRCTPDWCRDLGVFEWPAPDKEHMEDLLCGLIE
jgi:hypothetical protein